MTLANNWIEGVQKAAAVLIAQEDGYRTAGVTNVQVTDNMISDIENATQPGNNRLSGGHAAIDINTGTGSVARVLVAGNQVTRATYDGFRAVGTCATCVSRNRFVTIGGAALSLQVRNCPTDAWTRDGNTLDGTGIALTGCTGTGSPQVSARTGPGCRRCARPRGSNDALLALSDHPHAGSRRSAAGGTCRSGSCPAARPAGPAARRSIQRAPVGDLLRAGDLQALALLQRATKPPASSSESWVPVSSQA